MAGRLAPFIELGVGFNPELTARENVVLNGVMMGLSRREARRRLDAVLEFAELEEFVDLKLKNYSSGMLVRLAFAVMVAGRRRHHADRRGAGGRRRRLRAEVHGRLPREAPRRQDDRARHPRHGHGPGALRPRDAAPRRRARATSATPRRRRCATTGSTSAAAATRRRPADGRRSPTSTPRVVDAWLEDEAGERVENVEQGEPIGLERACSRRAGTSSSPIFGFHVLNADGVVGLRLRPDARQPSGPRTGSPPGERVRIAGQDREPAACPGRYSSTAGSSASATQGDVALQAPAPARLRRLRDRARRSGIVSVRRRRRGRRASRRPGRERAAPSSSCARSAARPRSAAAGGAPATCST